MAVIKKFPETLTQNLTTFQTYLVDTTPNSTYFKVTEFKDTFTGGKNGFLIEGSEHLMQSTEIKIEILDVAGNPIYYEPGNGVPEYYEGTSKLVAVYVYEDTPIGTAKITILGELKTYLDEGGIVLPIPDEWKNVYNVKWEKTFQVNKLLSNEDKVRFYRRPEVSINEIIKPIFSNVVTPITQKGFVDGFAQVPGQGERLSEFSLPTNYLIQINDGGAWTGSVVGTTVEFTDLGFTSVADDIISKTDLTLRTPYSVNGIVQDFSNQRYTASFNYVEGLDNLKTALTGSFGKITISDLETFVGDVARVKIFRKSQSDLADYQFIQEIQLESNELLKDLESTTKNEEFYGIFDAFNFKNYWVTSSNTITPPEFNQTFLYNSVRLDGNAATPIQFFTSKSIDLTENSEYTLNFNVRLLQNISAGNYIKFYISGSRTTNNVTTAASQEILKVTSDSTVLQKSSVTANFRLEKFDNAKLYIEVNGSGWYVSDISLRVSQESSFSPNEISFIQPIPRTLPKETFDFLFQFYDINNNYIPVIVEESKTFDGGNLNRINKSLELVPTSLYFQFDSGSGNGNPVNPTTIFIDVVKNFLTGSVTFTSRSFDFFNTELSSSMYDTSYWATTPLSSSLVSPPFNHWQFPGKLLDIDQDRVRLTVQNFTGSRDPGLEEIVVQYIEYTAECEGVEDSIIITRVIDGKGGVNYELRPYNGQFIRNSDPSGSLEVQAIRIDGVNEIKLRSGLPAGRSAPQIHVQSGSKYLTLNDASQSGFIKGLQPGTTGSGELNYNAIFNRDSIEGQLTLYLIPSGSPVPSASVLTVLTLTDLQDGLDAGVVLYDADTFTINPRLQTTFTPTFSSATASFFRRGRFDEPISCSIEVYPSMSINNDFTPEYWVNYITHSNNPDISVVAYDEIGNIIPSRANAATYPLGDPLVQSKQLLVNFVYTEPWTSASVSVDKLFTIVPEGKPGDESIVFEVNPAAVTLAANSRGVVNDFKPTVTDIRLKQGSRYLSFTGSREPGTFHIAQSSITASNVTGGLVYFDNAYTESLIISASSGFINLSGSITYPLEIQPYYTSSVYTASVVQPYTKVLEGPPPIQILISPQNVTIPADEVGFVTSVGYASANTTIQVKEGEDFLRFTTQSVAPGTWRINSVETRAGSIWNIRTGSLSSSSLSTATINYNRFDFPYVSASALYNIQVYPFALGSGHEYTSSIFTRTQTFTKNVSVPNARSVDFKASTYTVNFNRDGYKTSPDGNIDLIATAFNVTGSSAGLGQVGPNFYFFFLEEDGSETYYDGPIAETTPGSKEAFISIDASDAVGPGQNKTWKVKITDGKAPSIGNLLPSDIRAEGQLTIAGIKAGADAYKIVATNENASISGDLWDRDLNGTAITLTTFKGVTQLENVITPQYPAPIFPDDYDYLGELIGNLGLSSASIHNQNTQNWITQSISKFTTTPAASPNLSDWRKWAVSQSAQIIYKVDFENNRQTQFVTQSLSVQFTPPAPYNVYMQNDNSSVVYRVSGELEFNNTGNTLKASRGNVQLRHRPNGFAGGQYDAYDEFGYKEQYVVSILSYSSHLGLQPPYNTPNARLGGNQATASMPPIISWNDPENNLTGEIVYQIDCEYVSGSISRPGTTLFKTQSLSVQFEGAVGPGIVMRGEWSNQTDYIGQVENTNNRRDAVIYNAVPGTTNYYAAVSGSGPTTYVNPTTSTFYVGASPPAGFNLIGPKQPDTQPDFWEFLGVEEFFVAAKIAIFEESYVKNTINVGTVNGTGAFANIVIAGGRTDPYIAIGQSYLGQSSTIGTSGTSGTTLNPGGAVIGYERPGIFLGIYEQPIGAGGTTGRFSIVNGAGNRYLKWNGSGLEIAGDITVTGGDAATQTYANNAADAAEAAAIATAGVNTDTAITAFSNTLGAMAALDEINSGNAVTYITNGSIVTNMIATNAIMSTNFGSGSFGPGQPYSNTGVYSAQGSFFNLSNGKITSKKFAVSEDGDAFFKGDITGAGGNFGGNVTVGGFIRSSGATGLNTGDAGFYLAQDGEFRFGNTPSSGQPSISWDNNILQIRGKIVTDSGQISEIGNWRVTTDGNFEDTTQAISLNANQKALQIFDAGVKRVEIRQANVSDPAGSFSNVTVTIPPTYNFSQFPAFNTVYTAPGNFNNSYEVFDTTGFSVTTTGTYSVTTLDWGFNNNIYALANSNFSGYFSISVTAQIWTSTDFSGTLIDSFTLGYANNDISMPFDELNFQFNDGFAQSITFPAPGTYYVHTTTHTYGYGSTGDIAVTGNLTPAAEAFSAQLNQTEIGGDGILVVADLENYARIQRTTSNPIIDIKTNGTTPGLRITNTNPATGGGISIANAIEVLDGNISLSGAGNNFIVNGGFIGTLNTTGGIRFGTLGNNSVLMGANWPSQASNVATARLRPGSTKFGIGGRELIFDSSTLRVKTDIEDYPNSAYESIRRLKPVLYNPLKIINTTTYETGGEENYDDMYPMPNAKEYIGKQGGFIAEWLDEDPEMRRYVSYGVSGSAVTVDSLAYDKIIVPLTKTVQILMDKVEALEAYISGSL
jgi:hypothetical protein